MSIGRKLGGFCRVLMLAASISALSIAAARPEDLSELSQQVLDHPEDVALNLRYAHAAEETGTLRLALAAYERILINAPGNEEAQHGYERVRRALEPSYSVRRLEIGASWDSDPLNVNAGDSAYSAFFVGSVIDERIIGAKRWRSIVNLEAETTPDIEALDYAYLGAQTGPIFYVGPHTAAIPAIGGAIASLDDVYYFSDVNVGVTLEGRRDSMSYWARARAGYRDYGKDSTAEQGAYAEVIAGVSKPRLLFDRDTLVATPWVRWSGIEGATFDLFVQENVAPGEYWEYGLNLTYAYQVSDHLLVSAGALVRERDFNTPDRSDFYVAPSATVTLQNLLPCACDVRAGYQHRSNDSDDSRANYDADQVSLSLIARF